jgi:amidohydrolase
MMTDDPMTTARSMRIQLQRDMPELLGLAETLHADPELAFVEHNASALLADALAARGFVVERCIAQCETAFRAHIGKGRYRIAFCAEYDALPAVGHACGHNLIAASALGAAFLLAPLCDGCDITVEVLGTPGEEALDNGGKIRLFNAGYFDGLSAVLMAHPAPFDDPVPALWAAGIWTFVFGGSGGHSATDMGSALDDAALMAELGLRLLGQRRKDGLISVHRHVGHPAVNVAATELALQVTLRAPRLRQVLDLVDAVRACCAGAALSAGVTMLEIEPVAPYSEFYGHAGLGVMFGKNLATCRDFSEPPPYPLPVTTDLGQVSAIVPCLHAFLKLDAAGAVNHQREFAAYCKGPSAQRFIFDAALCLALTAADFVNSLRSWSCDR